MPSPIRPRLARVGAPLVAAVLAIGLTACSDADIDDAAQQAKDAASQAQSAVDDLKATVADAKAQVADAQGELDAAKSGAAGSAADGLDEISAQLASLSDKLDAAAS